MTAAQADSNRRLQDVLALCGLVRIDLVLMLSGKVKDEAKRHELLARCSLWMQRALSRGTDKETR